MLINPSLLASRPQLPYCYRCRQRPRPRLPYLPSHRRPLHHYHHPCLLRLVSA